MSFRFGDLDNPHFHHQELYPYRAAIGKNRLRSPQMNNITNRLPSSPLLTQEQDVDKDMFCNDTHLEPDKHCSGGFCECLHVVEVGLNDVVEMFIVDEGLPWDVRKHTFSNKLKQFHDCSGHRQGWSTV